MTKEDIIEQVSKKAKVSSSDTRRVMDGTINLIIDALSKGETIYLRGLFTLSPVVRASKPARVISRKESIVVPAHYEPHAKFSQKLRSRVAELPIE